MSLFRFETKDVNAAEIPVDLAFTKNMLKLDYSNLFMTDGSYQAEIDTYYLQQEEKNKYKMIGEKVF